MEFLGAAKIVTDAPAGNEDKTIDLLKEHLKEKKRLSFPPNDPQQRYSDCQSHISGFFDKHRAYVEALFNEGTSS